MITPEEGAYAFETLVRHDRAYSGYIPILGAPWLADLVRRSPWGEMFASPGQRSRGPSKFRMELLSLPQDEWAGRLRRLLVEQASVILRRTIDADRSFIEYGLDSLGMLEMRTHVETETGIRLTPRSSPQTTPPALWPSTWRTRWPRSRRRHRRHHSGRILLCRKPRGEIMR